MMDGVDVEATDDGVVVRATTPLTVVSSAVLGGGVGQAGVEAVAARAVKSVREDGIRRWLGRRR